MGHAFVPRLVVDNSGGSRHLKQPSVRPTKSPRLRGASNSPKLGQRGLERFALPSADRGLTDVDQARELRLRETEDFAPDVFHRGHEFEYIPMRIQITRENTLANLLPHTSSHIDSGMDLPSKIRQLRKRLGMNQAPFGKLLGVTQATVSRWEKSVEGQEPTAENLVALAKLAKVSVDEFLDAGPAPAGGRESIPVVGTVQAGQYREAVEWAPEDQYPISLPDSPNYPGLPRFGLEVRGPSMNRVYPEGTILVCVKVMDLNANPRVGQRVIAVHKDKHGLYEATVKELEVDHDGQYYLAPKSDSPAHRETIKIPEPGEFDMEENHHIWAVVITSILEEEIPSVTAESQPTLAAEAS